MASKHWETVKNLFEAARRCSPDARSRFLEQHCDSDEVRDDVESLLACFDESYLEGSLPELTAGVPAAGASLVGKTLDQYQILDEIGRGGMGVVYRALDTELRRPAAIKVLPLNVAFDPTRLRRFENEARSISSLNHPNIVTVYGIGSVGPTRYMAMELVHGKTLRDHMASGLSDAVFVRILHQVADGLAKAHRAGIVHRDLKPENLMISEDGLLKILDFGLAKLLAPLAKVGSKTSLTEEATGPGVLMGTVFYMSPEQAKGTVIDHRSDQFSLGSIAYEMLTGERAFERDSSAQTLTAIIESDPRPIRELRPDAPDALVGVVERALAKDPHARYETTDELVSELDAIRQSLSSSTGAVTRARGRIRRRISITAAAILLATTTAFVYVERDSLVDWLFLSKTRETIPFEERDWILIADFENLTGDDIFDKALDRALNIGISQSPYINVFPEQRTSAVLRRMKRSDIEYVDRDTAREIATRTGIPVVVLPTISVVGGVYSLSALIEEVATGDRIASEMIRASSKAQVLDSLDDLAFRVRRALGESRVSIRSQSKPLVRATTSSLEALKQHSLAVEKFLQWRLREAKVHLETALDLDPDYTAAKAQLGIWEFEHFDRDRGRDLIQKAVQEIDGLTERERLGILAFHARAVEGDLETATEHLRALVSLYPDHVPGQHTLGWYLYQLGRYADAASAFEAAIASDPHFVLSYNVLAWIYLDEWGEVDKTFDLVRRQMSYEPEAAAAHANLAWVHLARGELESAAAAFVEATSRNDTIAVWWFRLGHVNRMLGRYQEALAAFERALALPSPPGSRLSESPESAHYDKAVVYDLMGRGVAERESLSRYRALAEQRVDEQPEDPLNYVELALARSRLGEGQAARRAAEKARELGADLHFELARIAAVNGSSDEALDHLEQAVEDGFTNFVWMKIHPDFIALYDEPQFLRLIEDGLKL